jgi:hypothetical protein
MLIYSMSVSANGFITDREGGFEWIGARVVYERYVRA